MITTFFAYIVKIIFSVIAGYSIIYFLYPDNPENSDLKVVLYREFSLLTLLSSSFLGIFYIQSIYNENNYFYIVSILLVFVFTFYIYNKYDVKINSLYFLNIFSIVTITTGYVIYSFVTIFFYYFMMNNINIFDDDENDMTSFDREDES